MAADDIDIVVLADQFTDEEQHELMDRFDACTHGRKLRCDECSTRDWDQGRKDGFEDGFNWVIKEIEARAADAFIKRKSSAEMLRDMAQEIVEKAKKEKLSIGSKK
jgi:hypothetical protein